MPKQEYWTDGTQHFLNQMYPTPKERIKNPVPTAFGIGDVVKVLIGPATGKRGVVVVGRNGNFVDYEPYVAENAIGVSVFERRELVYCN